MCPPFVPIPVGCGKRPIAKAADRAVAAATAASWATDGSALAHGRAIPCNALASAMLLEG